MEFFIWAGILFCISQSAIFSGLNLALFSITRLRLEVEAAAGNKAAEKVLALRKDSNRLLTTVLWGNVGINVLLTLLSDSVLAGVSAFFFSTVVITILGEIIPQAYFSRHALFMASLLLPVLKFYRILLYPVTKPSAMFLDRLIGPESIIYFKERDFRELIRRHIEADDVDIDRIEGLGALNFLAIDDVPVVLEGAVVDERSIIQLPVIDGKPLFPAFTNSPDDPFLLQVQSSGKKWVIITDDNDTPSFVLDADGFLRSALFSREKFDSYEYVHRPVIITDETVPLGRVLSRLTVEKTRRSDDVIDRDIVLLWAGTRRIITGADILGRLMRGISRRADAGT
jgi:metal transporter CNNM